MGRLPAYLFVVRHGARLDAADKKWHVTSPTPYDPPLTYGGWLQSKALGARIGNILRLAEQEWNGQASEEDRRDSTASTKRKRRRFKVVIHSSPFLRCVQTSVAISAGIAQGPSVSAVPFGSPFSSAQSPTSNPAVSPFMMPTAMADILEMDPLSSDPNGKPGHKEKAIQKSVLRIDAFLGEWLSPEYYEMITPPPASALMIAGAKADLLRREDLNSYQKMNDAHHHASSMGQSALWNSPKMAPMDRSGSTDSDAPSLPGGLDNSPAMASVFPNRDRASSTASNSSQRVRFALPEVSVPVREGYIAPTPNYAISMSAQIPEGFVAHARDACITADYQWDSMREPLDWGDGGSFGEEWTAMHRRFRSGVQHLIDWYASAEQPAECITRIVKTAGNSDNECAIDDEEDDEIEPVVIIVSHGAGCNALIGAITHQPALMDVGMASLTMAVRKPEKQSEWVEPDPLTSEADDTSSPTSPKSTIPIHQCYDLKMFANTEHLRPTSGSAPVTQRIPSNTSPSPSSSLNPGSRGRVVSTNSSSYVPVIMNSFTYSTDQSALPGSRSNSANASLGSMRRTTNTAYSLPRTPGLSITGISPGSGAQSYSPSGLSSSPSVGLWSPTTSNLRNSEQVAQDDEDDDDDMFPDFDHKKKFAAMQWGGEKPQEPVQPVPPVPKSRERKEDNFPGVVLKAPIRLNPIQRPASEEKAADEAEKSQLTLSPTGLWGGSRPVGEAERLSRDMSTSKRRWTVNERA